jgi:hypothetical protein
VCGGFACADGSAGHSAGRPSSRKRFAQPVGPFDVPGAAHCVRVDPHGQIRSRHRLPICSAASAALAASGEARGRSRRSSRSSRSGYRDERGDRGDRGYRADQRDELYHFSYELSGK